MIRENTELIIPSFLSLFFILYIILIIQKSIITVKKNNKYNFLDFINSENLIFLYNFNVYVLKQLYISYSKTNE